jgi:enamine deaminase RidA (YjgF/YER057c/UK114 family)
MKEKTMSGETDLQALHPKGWKPARGYSNGIVASGRTVWLGGQIGWNGDQEFETDDFVGQVRQALENIAAILAEAGGRPENIVRMTWFITDKAAYVSALREVGEAYRSVMGKHFPVMSVVEVKALIEDRAKVEIETTAVLPE